MHYNIIVLTYHCTPFPYHNSTFPLGAIVTAFDQILFINQTNHSTQINYVVFLPVGSKFDISDKIMIETLQPRTYINMFSIVLIEQHIIVPRTKLSSAHCISMILNTSQINLSLARLLKLSSLIKCYGTLHY